MGINGLTTFLYNSFLDEILEEFELKKCRVVIDALSLLYKVHQMNNIQCAFGGNYDEFGLKLDELFDVFTKCQIEPIFLLDGGRDKEDRKFRTSLKRARQRLSDTCAVNSLTPDTKSNKSNKMSLEALMNTGRYQLINNFLPIMAYKILIDKLNKHKFVYFQCNFEADYELASLANELQCPVLSCDSDFYIYDLKHGYISLETFEMNTRRLKRDYQDTFNNSDEFYLPVKLYKIENFLAYFNLAHSDFFELKKEALPIFAVLCGNDYVDRKVFESLLKTFDSTNNNLKFRKLKRNAAGFVKRKHSMNSKLLNWLAQFESVDESVEHILKFVKLEEHKTIRKVVHDSVQEYMLLKPACTHWFMNEINKKNGESLMSEKDFFEMITFSGSELSREFVDLFRRAKISRLGLDVLVHRKVIFACQIEFADWTSTFLSSLRIREFFYFALLKLFDAPKPDAFIIREYLRFQKEIKIFELNLSESNFHAGLKDLNSIDSVFIYKNVLNLEEKVIESVTSEKYAALSLKLKNFFISLYFWLSREKNEDLSECKNENIKRAFFVSLIKSSVIDICYSELNSQMDHSKNDLNDQGTCLISTYFDKSQDENFLKNLRDQFLSDNENRENLTEIRKKLNQFSSHYSGSLSKLSRVFNLRLVHCLCEFQATYLSLGYVHEVLIASNPAQECCNLLELNCFFNGTFLHNFAEELEQRVNPDLYVEEVLQRKSLLTRLYRELVGLFDEMFLLEEKKPAPISSNRQKKNAKKNLRRKLNKLEKLKKEMEKNEENEEESDLEINYCQDVLNDVVLE